MNPQQPAMNWGIFDNQDQATFAFASRNVLPLAASYSITWPTLVEVGSADLIKRWYILGVGHVLINDATSRNSTAKLRKSGVLIAALNSLAFNIPDDDKFDEEDAEQWVKTCVAGYMFHMRVAAMSLLDDATYTAARAAGGPLNGIANLPIALAGWGGEALPNLTNNNWTTVINWLVTLIQGPDSHINLFLYTSMYIGLAKRGTITDNKLDKIKTSIREEIGIEPPLTEDMIASVYRAFGKYINETNAQSVFERWGTMMEERSLAMKILLAQTANAGLTAIETIRTALNVFPRVDWPDVIRLLPEETPHVRAALTAVQNNPYYGFKHDISTIASTKYKTFAWFAKELLIRKGGPQYEGLRAYGGWTRNPLHRQRLTEIIDNYNPEGEGVPNDDHRTLAEALRALAEIRAV